jgi:16S rRNA (guanine(966)-N(2))-methyltransferase RsmD
MLAASVPGCRFLDLFAGSGAVGIEAWSREAAHACWVERDARTLAVLRSNVSALCGLERAEVAGMDARRFIRERSGRDPFDVVFCDPPYAEGAGHGSEHEVLSLLADGNILADNGLVVFERGGAPLAGTVSGWNLADDRRYGGTRLRFWRPVQRKA